MVDPLRNNAFFQQLEADHRNWLSGFEPQYLRNWEKGLNDNEEAAFTEARFRQLLESWTVRVEPNEDLNGNNQRPDFCCHARNHKQREVEILDTEVYNRIFNINP